MRTDRPIDGQTDKTKLIAALRNFAKAPKNALIAVPSKQNAHYDKYVTGNWIFNIFFIVSPCILIH